MPPIQPQHGAVLAGDAAEAPLGEGLAHLGLGAGEIGPRRRVAAEGVEHDPRDLRDRRLVGGVERGNLHGRLALRNGRSQIGAPTYRRLDHAPEPEHAIPMP